MLRAELGLGSLGAEHDFTSYRCDWSITFILQPPPLRLLDPQAPGQHIRVAAHAEITLEEKVCRDAL